MTREFFQRKLDKEGVDFFKELQSKNKFINDENIHNTSLWFLERFYNANNCYLEKAERESLRSALNYTTTVEPSMAFSRLNFNEVSVDDINGSVLTCILGADLAITFSVIALFYSRNNNHDMASKLYAAASCFLHCKPRTRLITLNNLLKCYKTNGKLKEIRTTTAEVESLKKQIKIYKDLKIG